MLLLLHLPARASQVVVGLVSKNLLVWDVWEKDQQKLTHRLLLHSSAAQAVPVELRLRQYQQLNRVPAPRGKVVFRGQLHPGRLTQLPYPKAPTGHDFLEVFENGRSVGLLELNSRRPAAALVQNDLRFYTNSGANGGPLDYWLGFESLYAGPSRLVFHRFQGHAEEYELVQIKPGLDTLTHRPANLDSLAAFDPSILRLDAAHPQTQTSRPAAVGMLTLETEMLSQSFYYDEQKNKHPQRQSSGGSRRFIPVFTKPGT
ncbi:hypothetical protein [Hymenobacter metallicola]|uniref:Uncharacterized protein n=1 Tax=Hymenobacter metallicola TaxID=2563114 RepID=A0A4Z0Q1Q6_9BACT|nr:hypothetical protein [Hymenobacter metallicola]TGE23041.1 hypothetical protein E5K02_22060 [Hymenobacter metallicola]